MWDSHEMSCLQLPVWPPTSSCLEYLEENYEKQLANRMKGLVWNFRISSLSRSPSRLSKPHGLTRTLLDTPVPPLNSPSICLGSPAAGMASSTSFTGSMLTFQEVLQDCSVSPRLSSELSQHLHGYEAWLHYPSVAWGLSH